MEQNMDGFVQKLEELCVERELYYDCSNPWYGDAAEQKEKEQDEIQDQHNRHSRLCLVKGMNN